jgi:hypothetical protein
VLLVFYRGDSWEVEAEQKLLEEACFFSLCYNLYAFLERRLGFLHFGS